MKTEDSSSSTLLETNSKNKTKITNNKISNKNITYTRIVVDTTISITK